MDTIRTDVLVIGSGFGAAAPTLRLAQAGLSVVMVEKGPHIDHLKDFRQTQDPQYLRRYLHGLAGDHLSLTYAEGLGGGSGFYEMVSLRAPSLAFAQTHAGRRLWPAQLDRAALDPYYDRAEAMLRVEQIAPHDIPKSGLVFSLLMKNLGYSCDRARYAVRNCMGSGFCVSGCIYGAKQSLHLNYLPQAVAAGARIECDLEAEGVRTLVDVPATAALRNVRALPYRYEVRCRPRSGAREPVVFQAKIVILGGGTIGTAALLLRSRPDLPRLSSEVGKHIAFNGSVKVAALLPEHFPAGDMFAGRSHPGMISYQFLESHGISISAGKAMPLMVVSAARLRLDGDGREPAWWGQANVDLMRQVRHRMIALVSFGLTPPGGTITLGPGGEPALSLSPTGELQRYVETTHGILQDILVRNGCRMIETEWVNKSGAPTDAGLHFSTAHQVGSCRMADDRRSGVVNAAGEVFGYPGLYVSDGAAIPSSLAVNTSLTILANAERIADGIKERLGLP